MNKRFLCVALAVMLVCSLGIPLHAAALQTSVTAKAGEIVQTTREAVDKLSRQAQAPSGSPTAAPTVKPSDKTSQTPSPSPSAPTASMSPTAAAPTVQPVVTPTNEVVSTEQQIYKGDKSEIDATNKNDAYVKVRYTASTDKRLKVRVTYTKADSSKIVYNYDLNNAGNWEIFSMQSGSGAYTISVWENKSGSTYTQVQSQDLSIEYSKTNIQYLIPIQNINYTSSSKAVAKAKELTAGCATDLEKVQAVYTHIVTKITYDYELAQKIIDKKVTVYLPEVDKTLSSGKGICYDYSSLFAAMLRSIGIPARLVTGKVAPNNGTHAWNEVYITNVGWIKVQSQVYFDGKSYSRMDSTYAASNKNGNYTDFIGNGSNYVAQYVY